MRVDSVDIVWKRRALSTDQGGKTAWGVMIVEGILEHQTSAGW